MNHTKDVKTLAERLIEARTDKGLTQEELAKAAGIRNQSTIGMLESGRRLRSSFIPAVAAVLDVSALWLAEGRGPKRVAPQSLAPLTGHARGSVSHPASTYTQGQHQPHGPPALSPDEQALLDAYRLLEPVDREDLITELLRRADRIRRYVVKVTRQDTSPPDLPHDAEPE